MRKITEERFVKYAEYHQNLKKLVFGKVLCENTENNSESLENLKIPEIRLMMLHIILILIKFQINAKLK